MHYSWHDLLGNIGVLLVLGMYLPLQMRKVSAATPSFSFVNAVGQITTQLDRVPLTGRLQQSSLYAQKKATPFRQRLPLNIKPDDVLLSHGAIRPLCQN